MRFSEREWAMLTDLSEEVGLTCTAWVRQAVKTAHKGFSEKERSNLVETNQRPLPGHLKAAIKRTQARR